MFLDDPASFAVEVFREAVRRGFPFSFKRASRNVVAVKGYRGRGAVFVRLVDGTLVAAPDPLSPWHTPLARVSDGRIIEAYVYNVPRAIAHNEHIISSFEVDVWSRRLSLIDKPGKLTWVDRVPSPLKPYTVMGGRVAYLAETMDYLVVVRDIIIAWYNEVTARLDDAMRFQLEMGLL